MNHLLGKTIRLAGEYNLFRVGLGTNRIKDDAVSKNALKKAVKFGINFIDTASAYTGGISEKIIGETLSPYPKDLIIATKGGMHAPDFHVDSRPEALRVQLENSLEKLKTKTIPLYFLHRVDPKVDFKEQIIFLKEAQEEGKIKYIGLSDVSVEQIRKAQEFIKISVIENEYSLSERKHDDVLDFAEENNIVFVPFFPLHFSISDTKSFENLRKKYNATGAQLALAWLLKRSKVMLPIPGSLNPAHLEENIEAVEINLDNADFKMLSEIV